MLWLVIGLMMQQAEPSKPDRSEPVEVGWASFLLAVNLLAVFAAVALLVVAA